jgi:hypothetical protein
VQALENERALRQMEQAAHAEAMVQAEQEKARAEEVRVEKLQVCQF